MRKITGFVLFVVGIVVGAVMQGGLPRSHAAEPSPEQTHAVYEIDRATVWVHSGSRISKVIKYTTTAPEALVETELVVKSEKQPENK